MNKFVSLIWKLIAVLALLAGLMAIYLDALVSTTFKDRKWEVPAKVYARPLELYPGRPLSLEEMVYELDLLGYREVDNAVHPGQYARAGKQLDFYTRGFEFVDESVSPAAVTLRFAGDHVRDMRSGDQPLALHRLEPVQIGGIYPRHREDRLLVKLDSVPPTMLAALLAVEDQGFFDHWGLSLTGIARALQANMAAGRVVQGGSTLTQQLVKNYYLSSERSLWRKGREALMAVLLELHFGKEEILEAYVNEVFLAQDGPRAVHGFGLASRFFFGLEIAELGLHQQALLVGMVKGPSLYNPLRNPERAVERRNTVLKVMRREGVIGDVEATVAMAMPLGLTQNKSIVNTFPAFLDLVRRQLGEDYRQQDLGSLGLGIFTSFDPLIQRQAEQSVARIISAIENGEELETALVVTSFDNGEVLAMLGGKRPRYAGFNRAIDAVRPVGSLIKPAIFLAALEQPERYTLASQISDAPLTVPVQGNEPWTPRNFNRQSHGDVLLHEALSRSYNQAAARLGLELGIDTVLQTVADLGVNRRLPAVPAIMLGAGGLSPLDIAAMYQTIATGGFQLPLRTIRDVVDAEGKALQRNPLHYDRVVSIQSMHLLHYILREVVREGSGRGVYRYLPESFSVAGKTGTTNDNRDSWFAGFSGDLLAVSWIGRDDNGPTGLTGASGALRVWGDFMSGASRRSLAYRVPEGVEHFWVDEQTGALSGRNCKGARLMPFIEGSEPQLSSDCVRSDRGIMQWFRELF